MNYYSIASHDTRPWMPICLRGKLELGAIIGQALNITRLAIDSNKQQLTQCGVVNKQKLADVPIWKP